MYSLHYTSVFPSWSSSTIETISGNNMLLLGLVHEVFPGDIRPRKCQMMIFLTFLHPVPVLSVCKIETL